MIIATEEGSVALAVKDEKNNNNKRNLNNDETEKQLLKITRM